MIRDPSALLNIQVAFMGIVLVVGLFFLWKILIRIEGKVEKLSTAVSKMPDTLAQKMPKEVSLQDTDAAAQAFMNEVFGGSSPPLFLHPFAGSGATPSTVVVDEDKVVVEEEVKTETNAKPVDDVEMDNHSVVTTSTLSKSKVRKMSADALREICKERGLDTEGSRAALMERVLAVIDE